MGLDTLCSLQKKKKVTPKAHTEEKYHLYHGWDILLELVLAGPKQTNV